MSTLHEKIQAETWPETGMRIRYNIQKGRKQPELLTQYIDGGKISFTYKTQKTPDENWDLTKNTIQHALKQVYPITQRNNDTKEWDTKHMNMPSQRKNKNLTT